MEAEGTFVDDRPEEGEEPDENKPADSQRLIDAGVCIPEARSQVLRHKEYKLRWSGKERSQMSTKSASSFDADLGGPTR